MSQDSPSTSPIFKADLVKLLKTLFYRTIRWLPLPARRRVLYFAHTQRILHLSNPRLFTEKVNWRIVYDRREILKKTCDKQAVKELASKNAGGSIHIPRTLWSGTDAHDIPFRHLPSNWVLKPINGAGDVFFGNAETTTYEVASVMRRWSKFSSRDVLGEWAFTCASQGVLIEPLLGVPGVTPSDYKVYVFDGVPTLIQVISGRFGQQSCAYFDPTWKKMDVRNLDFSGTSPFTKQPLKLGEMLEAAASIGSSFDFIRVDFYSIDEQIWFGELSPYPAGGFSRFQPAELDHELGKLWQLPLMGTHPGALKGN